MRGTQGKQKPIGVREAAKMTYSPKDVGNALRARRVTSGLTKAELGRQLGISGETLSNWENGKAPIAACRIFSWLMGDHEYEELWKVRALMAEATLKDIQVAIGEYRDSHR